MAKYMIESPHSNKDCLKAMDEISAQGPQFLEKFDFGCGAGVHTGWAVVDAASESAAKNMLPSFLRGKAHVTAVNKYTPEQIKSFHEKK